MFQPKALLTKRTLKRISKRQILEWPQLEPTQDRINNQWKTKNRCLRSNNYKSANKCFKWVIWEQCCQDSVCLNNKWCHLCQTCSNQLVLMFRIKLLLSSNASLRSLNWANSKLSLVNFKTRLLSSLHIQFRCQGKLEFNLLEPILCFTLLIKFSTMMLNKMRAAKRLHHRNLRLLKRTLKNLRPV